MITIMTSPLRRPPLAKNHSTFARSGIPLLLFPRHRSPYRQTPDRLRVAKNE